MTYIKRKSKDPRKRLLTRADNSLQDYYRKVWGDKLCEGGCGNKMEVCHHYVLKSHSNRLRYEEKNLIALCKFCHSKVHGFHGEIINAQIVLNRGRKWLNNLRKLEREHITLTVSKLREIIEKYECRKHKKS